MSVVDFIAIKRGREITGWSLGGAQVYGENRLR